MKQETEFLLNSETVLSECQGCGEYNIIFTLGDYAFRKSPASCGVCGGDIIKSQYQYREL